MTTSNRCRSVFRGYDVEERADDVLVSRGGENWHFPSVVAAYDWISDQVSSRPERPNDGQRDVRIRFRTGYVWSPWYSYDDVPWASICSSKFTAVEWQETMTRAEFERYEGEIASRG